MDLYLVDSDAADGPATHYHEVAAKNEALAAEVEAVSSRLASAEAALATVADAADARVAELMAKNTALEARLDGMQELLKSTSQAVTDNNFLTTCRFNTANGALSTTVNATAVLTQALEDKIAALTRRLDGVRLVVPALED